MYNFITHNQTTWNHVTHHYNYNACHYTAQNYIILKFFGIVFIEFTTVNNFCLHMLILETNVVMEEDF